MGDTLFAAAAREHLSRQAPLAERLRPLRLDDIVGQDQLVGPGRPLRVLVESDKLSSAIFWGPAGTGKTTLAKVIARHTSKAFEGLSAVSASVKDVRAVLTMAEQRLGERQQGTILFLDEVHRFNKAQQDALLPSVESGLLVLVGATTENPYFEVNPPLMSRSTLFRLEPLTAGALAELVERGLEAESASAHDEAVTHLVERAGGDGRQALTSLEVAVALARARFDQRSQLRERSGAGGADTGSGDDSRMAERGDVGEAGAGQDDASTGPGAEGVIVTLEDVEAALGTSMVRYGRDDHYDVISAFIKSIRGSDPQAGLYWLARMLEAGEDARFIARRLVILASEDIGEADPTGLLVATAAAQAVEHVGLPEAQLNLAQAVVHLATAPKSNRSAIGLWRAREAVQKGAGSGTGGLEVPVHLRDAYYRGAVSLGHGEGYEYPHDDSRGWVDQQYLPEGLRSSRDARFYEPSDHGFEREIASRMQDLERQDDRHDVNDPPHEADDHLRGRGGSL